MSSQESMERTLKLFQRYRKISDIVQESQVSGGDGGGGGKRAGAAVVSKSILTLSCVIKLLRALFQCVVA